jgi:hypothetical protein
VRPTATACQSGVSVDVVRRVLESESSDLRAEGTQGVRVSTGDGGEGRGRRGRARRARRARASPRLSFGMASLCRRNDRDTRPRLPRPEAARRHDSSPRSRPQSAPTLGTTLLATAQPPRLSTRLGRLALLGMPAGGRPNKGFRGRQLRTLRPGGGQSGGRYSTRSWWSWWPWCQWWSW